MKHTIIAALILGATTTIAEADTAATDIEGGKAVIVYDETLAEKF